MKPKTEFSLILANKKNIAIKHLGSYENLKLARIAKEKRIIPNGFYVWIGEYKNGILQQEYE